MSGAWERELQKIVSAETFRRGQLATKAKVLVGTARILLGEAERLEVDTQKLQKRFKDSIAELLELRDDPEVLVRNYGGNLAYHHPTNYCGRVRDKANFDLMLLSHALDRGIPACTACGWRVKRDSPAA